jgi:hypothetical protein
LNQRALPGERRAQLVRGMRDELALRSKGALQPRQQTTGDKPPDHRRHHCQRGEHAPRLHQESSQVGSSLIDRPRAQLARARLHRSSLALGEPVQHTRPRPGILWRETGFGPSHEHCTVSSSGEQHIPRHAPQDEDIRDRQQRGAEDQERAFFDLWLRERDTQLLEGPSPDYPEVAFMAY